MRQNVKLWVKIQSKHTLKIARAFCDVREARQEKG
ncbi:hypothetical protein CULT_2320012 [[Clostridium] ultunense Esp]|nr:hypothetical protein CULT_2320012 [[Clostridium] ultunense Esp]